MAYDPADPLPPPKPHTHTLATQWDPSGTWLASCSDDHTAKVGGQWAGCPTEAGRHGVAWRGSMPVAHPCGLRALPSLAAGMEREGERCIKRATLCRMTASLPSLCPASVRVKSTVVPACSMYSHPCTLTHPQGVEHEGWRDMPPRSARAHQGGVHHTVEPHRAGHGQPTPAVAAGESVGLHACSWRAWMCMCI